MALAIAGCQACVSTPAGSAEGLHDVGGFIVWNCNRAEPEWFVSRTAHLDPAYHRAVIAHEESHRSLMLSMGCEEYHEWRQVPRNRLFMEAIAFCAQARQYIRDGMSQDDALNDVASRLAVGRTYGFGLTRDEARAAIVAVCS